MARQEDIPKTDPSEIEALIERVRHSDIAPRDAQLIERLLRLVLSMASLLEHKNASIKRLKRLIFGPGSDKRTAAEAKTEPTTSAPASIAPAESERAPGSGSDSGQACTGDQKPKRPGHGRNPSSAYTGARVVLCRHPHFKAGDHCPDPYCRGHLYGLASPAVFIQLRGQPLVGATKYEQEVLRCSACQERFTAPLPQEVRPEKYDATCDVSLALAKYGARLPHYRIARLQESYGVPLPESVQFERCESVADAALPVFLYLRRLAADGRVIYSDDTRVKILSCLKEDKQLKKEERRATNTSGLVIEVGGHRIALYANGRQHAGENLDDLLKGRSAGLERPIQMSDALAANWSGKQETIQSKCLAHARRKFIEIESSFPSECAVVLTAIAEVYRAEAEAEGMSAEQRLRHHQRKSAPVMSELKKWIKKRLAERQVEPNSGLGQALRYVLNHWEGLTRFLSVANCPLDNNAAERALKRAVLLRKNALFYKNEHGASVGAILLSLIETCRLEKVSAWAYLLWLMRHRAEARANPEACLPWNYARGEPAGEATTLAA
jgi:transposase